MGYHVADADTVSWEERPLEGQPDRLAADVTMAAELKQSRARLWRYPPHTRGRRHADHAQEEVFVVLTGTLTMLLGDPPERVDVGPHSVVAVEPMTPLQIRNESDEELTLFIYGAPPSRPAPTSSLMSNHPCAKSEASPPLPRPRIPDHVCTAASGTAVVRTVRGLDGSRPASSCDQA